MKKQISYFLLFTFYLFLFSCKEKQNSSVPPADTRVEWIKKTWDFGNITQGETVTHTFYFKNTGTQNLLIKNVETGCGCTTADYDKAPVRPGKEGKTGYPEFYRDCKRIKSNHFKLINNNYEHITYCITTTKQRFNEFLTLDPDHRRILVLYDSSSDEKTERIEKLP